jgi:hypothetical protein
MSVENLNIINTLAHTLDDAEIAEAINILIAARTARRSDQLQIIKSQLHVGDMVEWLSGRSGNYERGEVTKVKRKKAIVLESIHQRHWDIPMGMLKKV